MHGPMGCTCIRHVICCHAHQLTCDRMERLLGAAKELSEKVDSNETAAGDLLRQCETLQEELKAMKQVSLKTMLI